MAVVDHTPCSILHSRVRIGAQAKYMHVGARGVQRPTLAALSWRGYWRAASHAFSSRHVVVEQWLVQPDGRDQDIVFPAPRGTLERTGAAYTPTFASETFKQAAERETA